jgi:protein-tyrosine phosphatase
MIDLHSHILPGIDDGAESLAQSVALARIYIGAGFRQVVATPHHVPGSRLEPSPQAVELHVLTLNQVLGDQGLGLTVLPGMEIALDPIILPLLDAGRLLTLAGSRTLLVETPFQQLPVSWERIIQAIVSRGYRVLMAHPERCAQVADRPELAGALVQAGAGLQVNWASFAGHHGRACARTVRSLLARGLVHCLATDSHDPDDRHAGKVPALAAELAGLAGSANLALMTMENPSRVLRDEPLLAPTPVVFPAEQPRRWWTLFRA